MLILLLGSYDDETKRLLYFLRENLSKSFLEVGVVILLMERLNLFRVEDGRNVLTEEDDYNNLTVYAFPLTLGKGEIEPNIIDTISVNGNTKSTLENYLGKIEGIAEGLEVQKQPIDSNDGLFKFLVDLSKLFLIIRLREETRGGEYLELGYILREKDRAIVSQWGDIFLFKKRGIARSTMIDLFLNSDEIKLREFDDNSDLLEQIEDLVNKLH